VRPSIVDARLSNKIDFHPMHETPGSASFGLMEGGPMSCCSSREMRAYMAKMGIDT
jgi:hypothetical protein